MKILLITDEEWNDAVHGNNVLTNWFGGFEADFAQIYCSPGMPYNDICDRYFQITDSQMVHSILPGGAKAGKSIKKPHKIEEIEKSKKNAQRQGSYKWLKKLSLYIHTPMMLIRDAIWRWGHYDKVALEAFVKGFNPDIVFCPRLITPKLMRLEKIVSKMTDAPFVAFTADNEASLNHYSWSPLFWFRALAIHYAFRKHVKLYKHYFMFSEEQAQDYKKQYAIPTSCLYKCGIFDDDIPPKNINKPIRLIYAGKLYCNRWKTLATVGRAIELLNVQAEKLILDIYTPEELTYTQKKAFSEYNSVRIHSAITSDQLAKEYHNADIALHVESFDKKYRYATHYSFSTKIIDLMASSCAIMAICWEKHAGYQYLKKADAAFCISSYNEILPTLDKISSSPSLINEYADKAWHCGVKNHTRNIIHNQIELIFERVLNEKDAC